MMKAVVLMHKQKSSVVANQLLLSENVSAVRRGVAFGCRRRRRLRSVPFLLICTEAIRLCWCNVRGVQFAWRSELRGQRELLLVFNLRETGSCLLTGAGGLCSLIGAPFIINPDFDDVESAADVLQRLMNVFPLERF